MAVKLEDQVKMLEDMASSGVSAKLVNGFVVLGVLAAAAAIYWQSVGAAFIGAVALSLAAAIDAVVGKFKLAAKALREGKSTPGTVMLRKLSSAKRYEVTANDATGCTWVFACEIAGWEPSESVRYKATLHHTDGLAWPVLVKTESVLLYPLRRPSQREAA